MTTSVFLEIVLTFFLYPVPIFIYRYGIAKKRIEHDKAVKICFWYAIIPIVLIGILSRGQMAFSLMIIIFWSLLSYHIICGEYKHPYAKALYLRGVSGMLLGLSQLIIYMFFGPIFGEKSFLFVIVTGIPLYFIIKKILKIKEAKGIMKKIEREKEATAKEKNNYLGKSDK